MKKTILSALLALSLMIGITESANAEQKIAVINIAAVMEQSAQIQALNKEQQAKINNLEKWLETVKKDIDKQQTKEGKEKLFNKYQAEYLKKKTDIISGGQIKMQSISDNIMSTIQKQAESKGYNMIISKNIVLYGGEDITEDVINALNGKNSKKK